MENKETENTIPEVVEDEMAAITKEQDAYTQLPQVSESSLTLLANTEPFLASIKDKLGAKDPFYVNVSTWVARNAFAYASQEVYEAQNWDPAEERRKKGDDDEGKSWGHLEAQKDVDEMHQYVRMVKAIRNAWKVILLTDEMEMDKEFYESLYVPNRESIKYLKDAYNIDTTKGQNNKPGGQSPRPSAKPENKRKWKIGASEIMKLVLLLCSVSISIIWVLNTTFVSFLDVLFGALCILVLYLLPAVILWWVLLKWICRAIDRHFKIGKYGN